MKSISDKLKEIDKVINLTEIDEIKSLLDRMKSSLIEINSMIEKEPDMSKNYHAPLTQMLEKLDSAFRNINYQFNSLDETVINSQAQTNTYNYTAIKEEIKEDPIAFKDKSSGIFQGTLGLNNFYESFNKSLLPTTDYFTHSYSDPFRETVKNNATNVCFNGIDSPTLVNVSSINNLKTIPPFILGKLIIDSFNKPITCKFNLKNEDSSHFKVVIWPGNTLEICIKDKVQTITNNNNTYISYLFNKTSGTDEVELIPLGDNENEEAF